MISTETITEKVSQTRTVSVEPILEQIKKEDFLSETVTEITNSLLKQVQEVKWERNNKNVFQSKFIGVSILYSLRDKNIYITMSKNELTSGIILGSNLKRQFTLNPNIFKEKPYLTYYREGLYLLLCNRFRDFISPTEIGSGEELVRILNKANILDEELTNKINQEKVQLVIVRSH